VSRMAAQLCSQVGCCLIVGSVSALASSAGIAAAAACGAALVLLSPLARRGLRPWRVT
jgi:hypothetical protein